MIGKLTCIIKCTAREVSVHISEAAQMVDDLGVEIRDTRHGVFLDPCTFTRRHRCLRI